MGNAFTIITDGSILLMIAGLVYIVFIHLAIVIRVMLIKIGVLK